MDLVDDQAMAPAPQTRGNGGSGLRGFFWEILQTVLLTLVIFLAVRAVVQNFKVEGASMEPSLHSGQYLLINKIGYARLQGTPAYAIVHPDSAQPSDPGYLFGGPPGVPSASTLRLLVSPGLKLAARVKYPVTTGFPCGSIATAFTASSNCPPNASAQTRLPLAFNFVTKLTPFVEVKIWLADEGSKSTEPTAT